MFYCHNVINTRTCTNALRRIQSTTKSLNKFIDGLQLTNMYDWASKKRTVNK